MSDKRVEPLTKTTADIAHEQIDRLKQIFPECVTEGQVNFDLLTATPTGTKIAIVGGGTTPDGKNPQ